MALEPEVTKRGDTLSVELMYPRNNEVRKVQIDLCDVRASDGILVEYDFERDGWSIKQASTFGWAADDKVMDSDWQEVAFIQAWGRKKPDPFDCPVGDLSDGK